MIGLNHDKKFSLVNWWIDGDEGNKDGLVALYGKIEKVVTTSFQENKKCITIVIDDFSLMEVAANGSTNYVLDFLRYCRTLTSAFVRPWGYCQLSFSSSNFVLYLLVLLLSLVPSYSVFFLFLYQGCSLVVLNHEDIYSSIERPALILQMEYLADILIKAEPLATGLATDVHGQVGFCYFYLNVLLCYVCVCACIPMCVY